MRNVLILLLALCVNVFSFAQISEQQVISTSGETYHANDYTIDFTIGEISIETHNDNNYMLSQGFHQPQLIVTSIKGIESEMVKISVFPNPTLNDVTIKSSSESLSLSKYEVLNINGQLLLKKGIKSNNTKIHFDSYVPGIYLLRIYSDSGCLGTYKVHKQ